MIRRYEEGRGHKNTYYIKFTVIFKSKHLLNFINKTFEKKC